MLVMGNRAGTIVPNGGTQQTIHVPIYLDGKMIADVVDRQLGQRPYTSSSWR